MILGKSTALKFATMSVNGSQLDFRTAPVLGGHFFD